MNNHRLDRFTNGRVWRALVTACTLLVVAAGLPGCANFTLGGAVVGSAASTDRLTSKARDADDAITEKAEQKVGAVGGPSSHIKVFSFNQRVLLTGEVKDDATKAAVERAVSALEGVRGVANELDIAGASSFGSRSNDALITAKVRASFVDTKTLYANSIKVVTERGIVYLLGRVTTREGQLAAEVARTVGGVQKVIKIFETISEDELKRLIAK